MKRALLLMAITGVIIAVPSRAAGSVVAYQAAFAMSPKDNNPFEPPTLAFVYDTELEEFLQADLGWEASYASLIFGVRDISSSWNMTCYDDPSIIYTFKRFCAPGGPAYLFSVLTEGGTLTWSATSAAEESWFVIGRADGYRVVDERTGEHGRPRVSTSGTVTIHQVPEPTLFAMLLTAAGLLMSRRRALRPTI
jgi:hypothetical protein